MITLQVHKGTLRDGTKVAVKLQYPTSEQQFYADLDTVITFVKLAQPQHLDPFLEFKKQFKNEFNYTAEAQLMMQIHENIMPEFGDQVLVPRPHLEYTTKKMLTMDLLEGRQLVKAIQKQYKRIAEKRNMTFEELSKEMQAKGVSGMQPRPCH